LAGAIELPLDRGAQRIEPEARHCGHQNRACAPSFALDVLQSCVIEKIGLVPNFDNAIGFCLCLDAETFQHRDDIGALA
jgi:hypothetical protein